MVGPYTALSPSMAVLILQNAISRSLFIRVKTCGHAGAPGAVVSNISQLAYSLAPL